MLRSMRSVIFWIKQTWPTNFGALILSLLINYSTIILSEIGIEVSPGAKAS